MVVDSQNIQGIKGVLPVSMLDWEGRLVTTIFMGSCNMRCPFCHNFSLALDNDKMPDISKDELLKTLTSKQGWIDGVCITGGEPTINPGLFGLIALLKDTGYKIKLDTNGSRPDVLSKLLSEQLIDAVAMDIKTIFSKYPLATGVTRDFSPEVEESAKLIVKAHKEGIIETEFRTTVVPEYVELEDIEEIAEFIGKLINEIDNNGSDTSHENIHYYLQQFNPKTVMQKNMELVKPYTLEQLEEMAKTASRFIATYLRS